MRKLALFLIPGFIAGCAAPYVAPLSTSMEFKSTKDQVWPILISEIAPKYPVRVAQKDSGLITCDTVLLPGGMFNMGEWKYAQEPNMFLATWDGLRMNLTAIVLDRQNGGCNVSINIHFEAFENNVSKSWVAVRTTGVIEHEILESIESKIPR
jgi:hypothetical protein